jgi:hypothetical protein
MPDSEVLKSPSNLAFLTTTPHLSPPLLYAPSHLKTKMNLISDGTTYTIIAGTALGRQDKESITPHVPPGEALSSHIVSLQSSV